MTLFYTLLHVLNQNDEMQHDMTLIRYAINEPNQPIKSIPQHKSQLSINNLVSLQMQNTKHIYVDYGNDLEPDCCIQLRESGDQVQVESATKRSKPHWVNKCNVYSYYVNKKKLKEEVTYSNSYLLCIVLAVLLLLLLFNCLLCAHASPV